VWRLVSKWRNCSAYATSKRRLISCSGEDEKQKTLLGGLLKVFACKSGKDFLWKGGEYPLAVTKARKEEVLAIYADWLKRSQAVILVEYTGVTMKALDNIRAKIRESGGEFHVVKNTLARRAFADNGMDLPADYLVKSTAVSFAFTDPASTAKALSEATKGIEFVKVKGGFMSGQVLDAAQVKALAEMPPLPVVRAQLLGVLQAPAGKLVRTIAEPARGLAAVLKAFAEKAPAAA
jgi:large subunit ribosomal protein L10